MDNRIISDILISQYMASLGMLRHVIETVPDIYWNDNSYSNPNWQMAYHVLWATKLYLGKDLESYVPFQNAIEGAESLGGLQDWENAEEGVIVDGFHTKTELLSFVDEIEKNLRQAVEGLPLEENSGFEWYPYSRLELHLNTIRHIQHHTAQLIERLKAIGLSGFPWWSDKNPPMDW